MLSLLRIRLRVKARLMRGAFLAGKDQEMKSIELLFFCFLSIPFDGPLERVFFSGHERFHVKNKSEMSGNEHPKENEETQKIHD